MLFICNRVRQIISIHNEILTFAHRSTYKWIILIGQKLSNQIKLCCHNYSNYYQAELFLLICMLYAKGS